jgi:hypothetical protein
MDVGWSPPVVSGLLSSGPRLVEPFPAAPKVVQWMGNWMGSLARPGATLTPG